MKIDIGVDLYTRVKGSLFIEQVIGYDKARRAFHLKDMITGKTYFYLRPLDCNYISTKPYNMTGTHNRRAVTYLLNRNIQYLVNIPKELEEKYCDIHEEGYEIIRQFNKLRAGIIETRTEFDEDLYEYVLKDSGLEKMLQSFIFRGNSRLPEERAVQYLRKNKVMVYPLQSKTVWFKAMLVTPKGVVIF